VSERYLGLLRESLSAEAGKWVDIKLALGMDAQGGVEDSARAAPPPPRAIKSLPRDHYPQLDPRYTFAEFVVGSANQFAHAAALAVANQPGEKYNPLFIYGGVGLGKTHLLTAIGHQLWASGRRAVLFMTAESFMNELISSLRRDRMGDFKEKFRRVDALLLDDVQFLAGREQTQEEFFHTFNSLCVEGHQTVITSDKVPREIAGLEERLRNRFESGLIAEIAAPDLETRVAIIQKKAGYKDLRLPSDVAVYIAQNVRSNVRELEGCLNRLSALASMSRMSVTIKFARQALHDLIQAQDQRPGIEVIQHAVADFFHIRLADLKSKKRTQRIAFCRQVAMYLCRKLTDSSFPAIGQYFGRDHSTVIHANNLIARRISNDAAFRMWIDRIERELNAEPPVSATAGT
jgi:chromosomal replication initiator protein